MTNKTTSPLAGQIKTETFAVPGCDAELVYERDAVTNRLVRLSCGDCVYVSLDGAGERTLGDNLASIREEGVEHGMLRHVRAGDASWVEEYRWDDLGRPLHIDGIDVERDDQRRITACRGDGIAWRYAYAGHDLAVIDAPPGLRHITRGVDGRPVALRFGSDVRSLGYSDDNRRDDVAPLPETWHRDPLGRLWTIAKDDGGIETTYLWDGFACLGRIDGPPGEPLAAAFSLDLSCTPVRVISAAGMTRIPRDAFGESLLAHERVPGLYGGAIHDRLVHFRSRVLDPQCGAFDRRDPWHGRSDDPRRAGGFGGTLLVETPECGPYAVCQYDPIGRTDPTGEFSWALLLSDLTWSLQHNTAGLFGFDWTIGFWSSFIVGVFGFCWTEENALAKFFDYEGLYNERTGVWAVRRGFWGVARPFTYQHLVISKPEAFDDLKQINVIDAGDYRPTLYGTMLRAEVFNSTPILLQGNDDNGLAGWTRCGGTAEAVAPGSATPWFPRGGIHLDTTLTNVSIPLTCDLTELVPNGTALKATVIEPRIAVNIPYEKTLEVATVVFLSDGTNVEAKSVADVDEKNATKTNGRRVRFVEPGTALGNPVRLRALKKPTTDTRSAVGAAKANALDMVGHKFKSIDVGDPLRFKQGGKVVGAGTVLSFEAQLVLDAALPGGVATPLEIRKAVAGAKVSGTIAGNVLTVTSSRPDQGDAIVLSGSGKLLGAVVTATPSKTTCELDRTAAELAPLGANVDFQPLKSGDKIGVAAHAPAAADLTYTPEVLGNSPANGFVLITDASKPKTTFAREITSRKYDAIVIDPNLPGVVANPYEVDRFEFAKPDIPNLNLSTDTRIQLAAGVKLNAKAIQVVEIGAPALAANGGAPAATVIAGGKFTMAALPDIVPNRFILISGGGTDEMNVVKAITADLTLDRQIAFDAAGGDIDVVPLAPSGLVYDATAVDATHLVVQPKAAGVDTQFPRFVEGTIVQTIFGGKTEQYLIASKPDGCVITLAGGPPGAAIAAAANGTVQLLVPADPGNGTWRLGMNGKPVGAPLTDHVAADVWGEAPFAGLPRSLAVVQGRKKTFVANATAVAYTVTPLSPTTVPAGAATVSTYGAAHSFYAATTVQIGTDVTLTDTYGVAPVMGPNAVVIVPYGDGAAAKKKVTMSTGSVLVPEDAETWEVDRHKSLVFHELTHTRQAQVFGPLFMGYFPLFAIDGLVELVSDIDLPSISAYVAGMIVIDNGNVFVNVADGNGVNFEKDAKVELTQAGVIKSVSLGEKSGQGFAVSVDGLVAGPVQVRRFSSDSTLTQVSTVAFNILNILTLGGVVNLVAGTVWGGLLLLIFKLIYWLQHGVAHGGEAFPATVLDAQTLRMSTPEGAKRIQGFGEIFLTSGKDSDKFEVTKIENDTITLAKPTGFTGTVDVKPYSTSDPLSTVVADTLTYHDATVPDPARPAQVKVTGLDLDVFDVVSINVGVTSTRTNVVAVDANDKHLVTLEQAPKTFGPDRSLRIAYVDENDPFGSADSRFLTQFGMGWMRSLFDPYRQFQYGLDPKPDSFPGVIARIGRYAFSSHSWSAAIPGKLFLDDLFYQPNNGRKTGMEQQASNESGNVYSAILKLRGDVFQPVKKKFGELSANVGDIGRFWHTPNWFNPSDKPFTLRNRRDAPSLNLFTGYLVTVPEIGAEGGGNDLNHGATTTSLTPGTFVPDVFYDRPPGNPYAPTPTPIALSPTGSNLQGPRGVLPSTRGMIPTGGQIELSMGCYVSFTHPGKHRVTLDDLVGSDARDAHDAEEQTVLYDVTVQDVAVSLGDAPVTDGITVDLLPFQRAPITVDPSPAGAVWVATVLQPGKVVTPVQKGKILEAKGPGADVETVEISRLYAVAGTTYAESILSDHGVHLPVDIHVPIRRLQVKTVDVFQFVDAPKSGAPTAASAKPGTKVYAKIPTNIVNPLRVTNVAYAVGVPKPFSDPKPKVAPIATPAELAAAINVGKVVEVEFAADDPPEDVATFTFTANVGSAGPGTAIKATIDYQPHFQLTNAASFDVKQGGPEVVLDAGGTDILSAEVIEGDPKNIHLTPDGATVKVKADAGVALGARRIRAVSKANPTQKATRTIHII